MKMSRRFSCPVVVVSLIFAGCVDFVKPDTLSIRAASPFSFLEYTSKGGNFTPFDQCERSLIPPTISDIPQYVINLDLPPEERWKELVRGKTREMLVLIENIKRNCDSLFGQSLFWMVDHFLPHLTETLPSEYKEELAGISNATGISLGEITLFNVFYEFFSVCTSIVAESKDGVMYHGRNLDFGLFLGWDPINHTWQTTSLLRPLAVQLHFTKNNKILYHAVNYAGYIGILTALKPGKFSLSVDERFGWNGGYLGLAEWILGKRDQQWIGFLTRQVMENCSSYFCAQKKLSKPPLIAPVYFILTGSLPKQACVITRSRSRFNIWPFGQKQSHQNGSWFLVQTNYDQWRKPPFYDDRRTPAIYCLDQLGNDDVPNLLTNVLSTRPVLNKLTTFTAVMSPKKNIFKVWLQFCADPCWPW